MTATGASQLGVRLSVPEVKRSNRASVAMQGWLHKQGSDGLMLWKKRWFVLSEYCLFYYKNSNEEKVLGSILLPSYKISPCSTAEGNLFKKKFSFKAEHANVRTYYFAADSKEEMIRWMNVMSLATIAQEHRVIESAKSVENRQPPASQFANHTACSATATSKPYDYLERTVRENRLGSNDGARPAHGSASVTTTNQQPLYVNAPPKPRRYNETPCSERTYSGGCSEMENFVLAHTTYPTADKYTFRNDQSVWPPTRKRTISSDSAHQPDKENIPSNGYCSAIEPALLRNRAVQKSYNHRSDTPVGLDSHHDGVDDEDCRFFNALNWSRNHKPSTSYTRGCLSNERPRSVDIFLQSSYRSDSPQQSIPPPSVSQTTTNKNRAQLSERRSFGDGCRRGGDDAAAAPHRNVAHTQPLPRPKSSIDMVSSDHFHWSAEQYAQNMRKSAQFLLVSKARQLPLTAAAAVAAAATSSGRNTSSSKSTDGTDVDSVTMAGPPSNDHSPRSNATFTAPSPAMGRQSSPNCRYLSPSNVAPTNRVLGDFQRSKSARLPRDKQCIGDELDKSRGENLRNSTRHTHTVAARSHSSYSPHIDQREESMKRLLEWKQRMLQSPLTRKSTSSRVDEREMHGQRLTLQNTLANTTHNVDKNCVDDGRQSSRADFDTDRLLAASRMSKRSSFGEGSPDKSSVANSKSDQTTKFSPSHYVHEPRSSLLSELSMFSQTADLAAAANRCYSSPYSKSSYNDADSTASEINLAADSYSPRITLDKCANDVVVRDLPRQNLVQDRIKAFERIPSAGAGDGGATANLSSAVICPPVTSLSSTLSRTIPLTNLADHGNSPDEYADKMDGEENAWSETDANEASSINLTSKGIFLSTAGEKIEAHSSRSGHNNDDDDDGDGETPPKTSSSTNRRLTEVNESNNQCGGPVEDHYLPMAPSKKTVFSGANDLFYHTRSNSASSASQIMILETLLSEDNENSYVEMTVGDDRSSVGSAVVNKSNDSVAGASSAMPPKITTPTSQKQSTNECNSPAAAATAADKSHYEFLYRASSSLSSQSSPSLPQLLEPLYMEVSSVKESSISTIKQDDATSKTAAARFNACETEEAKPIVLPDILNTSNAHRLQTANFGASLDDGNVFDDKDLYPIAVPAHPRFSLSDTFRPASYYLGGSCATRAGGATLGARSTLGLCFDQPDSSDSDLVPPPPIPATVADDLNVSLDTVKSETEASPFSYSMSAACSATALNKDYAKTNGGNFNDDDAHECGGGGGSAFYTDQTKTETSLGEFKQPLVSGGEGENLVFKLRNHFKNDEDDDVDGGKPVQFYNTLTAPYYYADLLKANGDEAITCGANETSASDGEFEQRSVEKKCDNLLQQQQSSAVLNNKRATTNADSAFATTDHNGSVTSNGVDAVATVDDAAAAAAAAVANYYYYNSSSVGPLWKQNNAAVGKKVNHLGDDHRHGLKKSADHRAGGDLECLTAAAAAAASVATFSKTIDEKNIYNSVLFHSKFASCKYDLAAIAQAANSGGCASSCNDNAAAFERTTCTTPELGLGSSSGAVYRRRSQSFDGLLDQANKLASGGDRNRCEESRAVAHSTLESVPPPPPTTTTTRHALSGNLRQTRSLDNLDKNVACEYESAAAVKDDTDAVYAVSHDGANWPRVPAGTSTASMERKKAAKQISRDVTYVNDCVFTQMKKVKQSFKEYTEDYREIRRIKRYSRLPAMAAGGVDAEESGPAAAAASVAEQRRLSQRRDDIGGDGDAFYERLDPRATIQNGDTGYQAKTSYQTHATTNACGGQNSPTTPTTTAAAAANKTIEDIRSRLETNAATTNAAVAVTRCVANDRSAAATAVQIDNKTGCDETTTKEHGKNNTQPKSGAQSFLEEGVYPTKPPSSFEIDREKLRQWDLMSSAPVAMLDAIQKYPLLDALASQTNHQQQQQQQQLFQLRANIIQMTDSISNSIALTNSPALDLNCANGPDQMSRINHAQMLPNLLSPITRSEDERRLEADNRTDDESATAAETNRTAVAKQLSSGSPDLVRVMNSEENLRSNMATAALESQVSGNTHEELILLLIKLRRQNVNIYKAIESCHLEIERQARSIQMEKLNKVTDVNKLKELKSHLNDLEKQYEKGKPLVNLVDNMVKLGSLYKHYLPNDCGVAADSSLADKIKFNDAIQEQRLLDEEHKEWQRVNADDNQLQAKIEELYKLDEELQRESTLLQNLKQDKDLLEYALGGLKNKIRDTFRNSQEMEKYTRQQSALELELGHVRSVLAKNSQKLEEMVTTNARLENELTILRQKLRTQLDCAASGQRSAAPTTPCNENYATAAHNNTPGVVRALENELKRVQLIVGNLQRQRNELECQVRQLTEKSKNLYHRTEHTTTSGPAVAAAKAHSSTNRLENSSHGDVDWFESSPNVEPILDIGSTSNARQQIQHVYSYYDDDVELNDQLDNKTKQFYGIIPREKCQEIKTVRIVKRESERRHKDRDRCCSNIGIPLVGKRPFISTIHDENLIDSLVSTHNAQMGGVDSVPPPPPNDDNGDDALLVDVEDQRQRRQLSAENKANASSERECDANTTSPRLSPVLYQSNAAKEIVRELVLSKGADAKTAKANDNVRRSGIREKRRHHTISHSKPIPFLQNYRNDTRCRDDVDLERELRGPRLNTTPDVVKSTLHKTDSMKYDPETIDSLLGRPKKISIPERYVPENVPELSAEEQTKRLKKTEAIRKMLSQTSAVAEATTTAAANTAKTDLVADEIAGGTDDERNEKRISNKISTNKLEENKRERDYILQLNQILAQQVMEKSKLVAGTKKS